jgi:two-component system sensor histidine kinase/response regulator
MTDANPESRAPSILVVDDEPTNLSLLHDMLKKRGYKPRPVSCGRIALETARAMPPDLVLLDVNMPDMNGHRVCRAFKADPLLKDIPILFLSAMKGLDDKVQAFQEGAVDFISKPFFIDEVDARVKAHLEICHQRRELAASYRRLKDLEALRDNLTHMIVHDMRSPLFVIELALLPGKSPSDQVRQSASRSLERLKNMTTQMLDISRLEAGQMPLVKSHCELTETVKSALEPMPGFQDGKRWFLDAPELVRGFFDYEIIHRVVSNLLANAHKFTPQSGTIRVTACRKEGRAYLEVADSGPGIPSRDHQRIFEKFGQADSGLRRLGAGLGLAFCKLAIEAHGGTIGVQSEVGKGSTFWISLPALETPAGQGALPPETSAMPSGPAILGVRSC